MQFLTLFALFGATLAAASPDVLATTTTKSTKTTVSTETSTKTTLSTKTSTKTTTGTGTGTGLPVTASTLCPSLDSCLSASGGKPAAATKFCASVLSVKTITSGTTTKTVNPKSCRPAQTKTKRAELVTPLVAAGDKPRCFKEYQVDHLAQACSCLAPIPRQTVPRSTITVTAATCLATTTAPTATPTAV